MTCGNMHMLLYMLNDICGGEQAVMQDIECNNLQRQTSDNTALYFSLLKNYLQLCFSIQLQESIFLGADLMHTSYAPIYQCL